MLLRISTQVTETAGSSLPRAFLRAAMMSKRRRNGSHLPGLRIFSNVSLVPASQLTVSTGIWTSMIVSMMASVIARQLVLKWKFGTPCSRHSSSARGSSLASSGSALDESTTSWARGKISPATFSSSSRSMVTGLSLNSGCAKWHITQRSWQRVTMSTLTRRKRSSRSLGIR